MNTTNISCTITILKELKAEVLVDTWNTEGAQKHVAAGIDLAIGRLRKYGHIELTDEELAITPLPKIDPNQLGFLPMLMV